MALLTASPRRRGSGLVEGALVSLAFLAVLVGIFDLAQILIVRHTFVERVRAAARYAAVHPDDQDGIRNVAVFGNAAASGAAAAGIFGLTPAMVTVDRSGMGTDEQFITVSIVNYPYRLYTPWISGPLAAAPVRATLPVEAP